jgi:hypothetical protein
MGFSADNKDLAREQQRRSLDMGYEPWKKVVRGRRPVGDQRVCKVDGCRDAGHYAGYCTRHFDAEVCRRMKLRRVS